MQVFRDVTGSFKYEKGFPAFPELHGIILLDPIDAELDLKNDRLAQDVPSLYIPSAAGGWQAYLLLVGPEEGEFAETDMERRACECSWDWDGQQLHASTYHPGLKGTDRLLAQ